jgi:glycosyltransferase involved in cell wall biosynthesis/Flp pilus assembly protein TadD
MMPQTLETQSQQHNNNYTPLEALYSAATGGELVLDPYNSAFHPVPNLTLSASIVIPAWNAYDTLTQCLIAIEQSSFNRKYSQQLEVVVVDDGSTDGTWELLQQMRLNVRLKAVRQAHLSRAHTQNTGIAAAEGDVIISCDADMILAPFAIEEMVKRHQVLEHVLLIGFRGDVERTDPRIQLEALTQHLPRFLPPFMQDVRLNYGAGWPESMCRDSNHFKSFCEGKHHITPDGGKWSLANMVYGALFSLSRADFWAMDGYDERFYGWGCEDTLVGVRALALENYIIPVYGAAGMHIAHGNRSSRKWQEFAANRRVFHAIMHAPFVPNAGQWLNRAKRRVREQFEREPHGCVEMCQCLYDVFTEELADPQRHGKYLHSLGRFDEAACAFAEVRGTVEQEAWALYDQAKALRAGGHPERAVDLLEEAAAQLPQSPWPPIELALALAALEQFAQARKQVERAQSLEPANGWGQFLLRGRHMIRAAAHVQEGNYTLAVRDYEAALILDPNNILALIERVKALASAGNAAAARKALIACAEKMGYKDPRCRAACLKLAEMHLARNEYGAAKSVLEEARRHSPQDQEVKTLMNKIHLAAAQAHPLPFAREIASRVQAIPGWLWENEAELLVALALKAVAHRGSNPPVLVEIGSYCGRSTIAIGLAARSLGRDDAHIISVDEPSIGLAPGGESARDVLHSQLVEHGLADMVIYAPEDDASPWLRASQFVLVDGRHNYAGVSEDVAKYAPHVVPGGYLLFHDYADYCPDVQRFVNEMLLDEACPFEFVAHTGTLIAFVRRVATTDEQLEQCFAKRAPPASTIWMYWEGPMPAYIALCCKTFLAHNQHVRLLDRPAFDALFMFDRDINIDDIAVQHKSDFISAYLLRYYGGIYVDPDCIVLQSLAPILEMVEQANFVSYREPQGSISCNFMAAKVGGEVITAYYKHACEHVRSGQPIEWNDLGAKSLEKAAAAYPGNYLLLPTEAIMPIAWNRSEELAIQRSDEGHERLLKRDAFCYMLSNNTIEGREQTKILTVLSEEELLKADYFISFLFRRALNTK